MRYYLREAFARFFRWLISPANRPRPSHGVGAFSTPPPCQRQPSRWQPPAVPVLNDSALFRPYFLAYEARMRGAAGRALGGEHS